MILDTTLVAMHVDSGLRSGRNMDGEDRIQFRFETSRRFDGNYGCEAKHAQLEADRDSFHGKAAAGGNDMAAMRTDRFDFSSEKLDPAECTANQGKFDSREYGSR
jgi:hypothetical protein